MADHSGTITTGSTAQQLMPANRNRYGLMVQNLSDADLWVSEAGTAAAMQPSLRIATGDTLTWSGDGVPTTAISIVGATTGQAFSAREW